MYQSVRDCGRSLHPEEVLLSAPLPEEQVQDWLRWAFPVQLAKIYSGTEYSVSDVMHELAAVMYNIGALHSRLGLGEERQHSDGIKMAGRKYQVRIIFFRSAILCMADLRN